VYLTKSIFVLILLNTKNVYSVARDRSFRREVSINMVAKVLAIVLGVLAVGTFGMGIVLSLGRGTIEDFFRPQLPATYDAMFCIVVAIALLIGAIAAVVIGGHGEK
jgi:hypothetical protein